MWSWGFANISDPDTVELGTDIASFVDHVSKFNSFMWFHNLKFDGKFLLDFLLRESYIHTTEDGVEPYTFQTLIDGHGNIYSITVRWPGGSTTEFRDSLKKLPFGVARVAESFNLDIGKGSIDYHKTRPIGYEPTEEEWEYLRLDVSIMAKAMAIVIGNGMDKLTVSGDAMAEYKSLVGSKSFKAAFPIFSFELDVELRRAYRGGWTYCDPRFSKRVTGPGLVFDVNSLYPSVMANELIPYGEPEFVSGRVEPTKMRPLTIFSVELIAKLKPNHLPCIQIKNSMSFVATDYLTEIKEPTTLMVTNIDWELYKEHYDITVVSWGGGWRFKAARGMFKAYINKWSKIKAEATGGLREIAKLHLNGLYGKFATNPTIQGKFPVIEDNILKFKMLPDEIRDPVYTPAGVFITSHARALTIRTAQANYDVFAYADTDSLHLLTTETPEGIDVHPSRMGAWKLEYKFEQAVYAGSKRYSERLYDYPCEKNYKDAGGMLHKEHGEWCKHITHISGVGPKTARMMVLSDMRDQNVLYGNLRPKVVPGGVVLIDSPFTLRV